MKRPRVIFDDGTPACLPKWAKDELVAYRLNVSTANEYLMNGQIERALRALNGPVFGPKYVAMYRHLRERGTS